ncbi:MAG: peptide chain release factor N(5)-glutamine methyltransferase [Alphaproteobacteria bacterium]|nr:peptide chain release factor N(5)-glutamine methyltransferase [Alphaproteobacteria bacterium]
MIRSRADALRRGALLLKAAAIERPRLEARLLLAHALGLTSEELLRDTRAPADMTLYEPLLTRRAAREPLALITGRQEFWSLPFAVSPATLIPRADTETLLEAALELFPERNWVASILDLGTGTGCLLLAALMEFPAAFGVGVDVAPDAARLAARNAADLGLSARAAFLVGDWAAPLGGRFELILSNPPYIETSAIPTLMPEVRQHEPAGALDGGPDGLDAYRRIIPAFTELLAPSGAAILEVGQGQAAPVANMAEHCGFMATTRADLAGIPRAVVLRQGGAKKPFGTTARGS